MPQPTSPSRTAAQVLVGIRMLAQGGWDSVWTVSLADLRAYLLKQLVVANKALAYYNPKGSEVLARQQRTPVYHRNDIA